MIFAFMYYVTGTNERAASDLFDRWTLRLYTAACLGFVAMFLYGGRESVPRRWAVHLPEWIIYDQIASIFGVLILLTTTVFVVRFLIRARHFLAE